MFIVGLSAPRPGWLELLFLLLTTADQIRRTDKSGRPDYSSLKNPGQTNGGCRSGTFLTQAPPHCGDQKSISLSQYLQ
jgi:hypothetical protein